MPKPRPSFLKRQREQAKRERAAAKAERRAQRKVDPVPDEPEAAEAPAETPPAE